MHEPAPDKARPEPGRDFSDTIGKRVDQKKRAQREAEHGAWFGLGMFGLIGWSVSIPTLLGIALGHWLDRSFPSPASWTLTFLIIGVALGCLNAWYWIQNEDRRR